MREIKTQKLERQTLVVIGGLACGASFMFAALLIAGFISGAAAG
ncbi:MAG: hypothetical protein AAFY22_07710 [Pseudomonadota bacterium]